GEPPRRTPPRHGRPPLRLHAFHARRPVADVHRGPPVRRALRPAGRRPRRVAAPGDRGERPRTRRGAGDRHLGMRPPCHGEKDATELALFSSWQPSCAEITGSTPGARYALTTPAGRARRRPPAGA